MAPAFCDCARPASESSLAARAPCRRHLKSIPLPGITGAPNTARVRKTATPCFSTAASGHSTSWEKRLPPGAPGSHFFLPSAWASDYLLGKAAFRRAAARGARTQHRKTLPRPCASEGLSFSTHNMSARAFRSRTITSLSSGKTTPSGDCRFPASEPHNFCSLHCLQSTFSRLRS